MVDAAVVAAETDIVLAVDPREGFRDREGLGNGELRLLLVKAGEAGKRHVGQAVIERAGIEGIAAGTENADLRGDIGRVGKEVYRLAVAAVPVHIEDAGQ